MIKLEYTPATGLGYRHRTWTRIAEAPHLVSALQNQFALSEYERSEAEAVQQFRVWLWQELKDRFNVVSTEMRLLAQAHQQGQTVEVQVPKDALHGTVIVRALLWLADQLPTSEHVPIRGSEPGPCYEPIVPDGTISTRAEIDPKYIVWITGRTQSRIGVIVGGGEAFVPEYGFIPLKNFRWVKQQLAASAWVQKVLNDELDKAFEREAKGAPVEYDPAPSYSPEDRFDDEGREWQATDDDSVDKEVALAVAEGDVMTLVEQLTEELGDAEAALAIAQTPEIEEWYHKRPPLAGYVPPEMMRPVYMHKGEQSPLTVKSVQEQIEGKKWRYATKEETAEYIRALRPSPGRMTEKSVERSST